MRFAFSDRLRGFYRRANAKGWRETLRQAALSRLMRPEEFLPLGRANPAGLLTSDLGALNAENRQQMRASSFLMEASQVEATYPLHIEVEGRVLRYAYLPATGISKGLAVLFHGHDAFLHLGPVRPWANLDLLAPWDTFGLKRQGSWFWGEKGQPFVERMVQALIARYRPDNRAWFTVGASMGGFAALYHGIKYRADGIYAMCPQVDLARKIEDFGADELTNPYRHLRGNSAEDAFPDLMALAEGMADLPPLYLVQNLFDQINPFAQHAWRLIEVYNRKSAWYGLRIQPSVGHGGDGGQGEAALFFTRLLDKKPPRTFPGFGKSIA
jgi:hypothetical protein